MKYKTFKFQKRGRLNERTNTQTEWHGHFLSCWSLLRMLRYLLSARRKLNFCNGGIKKCRFDWAAIFAEKKRGSSLTFLIFSQFSKMLSFEQRSRQFYWSKQALGDRPWPYWKTGDCQPKYRVQIQNGRTTTSNLLNICQPLTMKSENTIVIPY